MTITENLLADLITARFSRLSAAGFPADEAVTIATRIEIPVRDAIDLIERGCPPDTAVRILL